MKFTIISPKASVKDEKIMGKVPTQADAGEELDIIEEAKKSAPEAPKAKEGPKPEMGKDPIEKEEEKVKPLEDKEIKSLRDLLKIAPKLMKLIGEEGKEAKKEEGPKPEVKDPLEKKDAMDAEIASCDEAPVDGEQVVDTCGKDCKDSLKSVGAVENTKVTDSKPQTLADKEYAATEAMCNYYKNLWNSNN